MTVHTDYEHLQESALDARRLMRQEELMLEVTEALTAALKRVGVSQTELARRLHKTKGFVSQVLSGGRNLTLRTLADVADALDQRVQVELSDQAPRRKRPGPRQPKERAAIRQGQP